MSELIEARGVDSLQGSLDKHADATNREAAILEKWHDSAPKLISSVGQEIRDSMDHGGEVALRKGSPSIAIWLLIVLAYKVLLPLLKKWLGI